MLRFALLSLLAMLPAASQTFDAAAVRTSVQNSGMISAQRTVNPVRITYRNFTLQRLIMDGYSVAPYQVQGPQWIYSERFDIDATKPKETTPDQLRHMVQAMLTERFHLAMHRQSKELPAYVLLPGKDRSKLRPAKDVPDVPGCKSYGTMPELAETIAKSLNAPVTDQTGIAGTYFHILAWSPSMAAANDAARAAGVAAPPPPPAAPPPCPGWEPAKMPPMAESIFEAVREQMGLKLERRGTAKVEMVVVDGADRVPVKN